MPSPQCRAWIGTAFTDIEFSEILNEVSYYVWQRERCPETGRVHQQFFMIFVKKKTMASVIKLIGPHHIEMARDLPKSREYCMKEETQISKPVEYGIFLSGKLEKGEPVRELKLKRVIDYLEEHPREWRSIKQLRELRNELSPFRSQLTNAVLLYGDTGVGKTRIISKIVSYLGHAHAYYQDLTGWWDGYDAHPLVVMEEIRQYPVTAILRLLDRTPLKVAIKGSSINFSSHLVMMSSNLDLTAIFGLHDTKTVQAIRRRIKEYYVY